MMMGLAANEEGPNADQTADLHTMARGRQEVHRMQNVMIQ
jgi:hypothetical protein